MPRFSKHLHRLTFLMFLLLGAGSLFAQHYKKDGTPDRRYKENRSYSYTEHTHSPSYNYSRSYSTPGVVRDSHGRIKRSSSARYAFMKQTGYPHGRKGYIIDHIKPLKEGGCDCPENMQWQTIQDAKAKDKWE